MKILVVDDSELILRQTTNTLTSAGFEVETAGDGAEAFSKYFKIKPDVVLLDLVMPLMNGYETLSKILGKDKDAKIIINSSSEDEKSLMSCIERGAIGYIVKPCRPEELLNSITIASCHHDKNILCLFLTARNKIEVVIQKLFTDASIILREVEVIRDSIPPFKMFAGSDQYSTIRAVPEPIELKIEAPPNTTCYVTEVSGECHAKIVTLINNEHLTILNTQLTSKDGPIDFFDIINLKMLSTISDIKNMRLVPEPTRQYDQAIDKDFHPKEMAKGRFTLATLTCKIPLELQIWVGAKML